MRIVPNLKTILKCPNCGSNKLYEIEDPMELSVKVFCLDCHEEIVEGNTTTDNSTHAVSIPYDESRTIQVPEVTTHGKIIADALRQEIGYLRTNIHDTHSMVLVNRLTDILNLIADYIEEH